MDIECRWLDSFHDAKVFCSSKINTNLKVKEIPSTELTTRPGSDAISNYIIGDPAYPLMSYCIQKFTSCSDIRSSLAKVFCKKVFLEISQNSQETTCSRASFLIKLQVSASNFTKKGTPALVISCEFCEIFKNTCFYRAPPVAASEITGR